MQSLGTQRTLRECSTRCISKCGHLDWYNIGTCEMWAREKGLGTIWTCATKLYYLCEGVECVCQHGCTWKGKWAHELIIQSGLESIVFVGSNLVDMYAKCGNMEDVWNVFNKMPSWDVVTWTTIFGRYLMHGHGKETFKHFEWMYEEGVKLDHITFFCIFS
jgi:pentatricopeptide repeat protein